MVLDHRDVWSREAPLRETIVTSLGRAGRAGVRLAAGLLAAVWSVFWLAVARLHLLVGDYVAALALPVIMVGPVLWRVGHHVGAWLGLTLPQPNLDLDRGVLTSG